MWLCLRDERRWQTLSGVDHRRSFTRRVKAHVDGISLFWSAPARNLSCMFARPLRHPPTYRWTQSALSRPYRCTTESPTLPKRRWFTLGAAAASIATGSYWIWHTNAEDDQSEKMLSPARFSPTTLTLSEDTSETTKLVRLTLPPAVVAGLRDLPPVWSVYVKDSDIQVERPYTPLEGVSDDGTLTFWIRKYPHGEVGRWLHSKAVGDRIEIRGPEQTWSWQEIVYDDVVMVAYNTFSYAEGSDLLCSWLEGPASPLSTSFCIRTLQRVPRKVRQSSR